MSAPAPWKVRAAYAAVYTSWGSTYLAIKLGVENFSPSAMTGLRFILASSLLYGLARLSGKARGSAKPRELACAAGIGMLMLSGGTGLLSYAEQSVPSGVCSLVLGCSPILFALFNRLAGGPPLSRSQKAGGLLALFGVVLLALHEGTGGGAPRSGLLILCGASLCWVSASVASKHVPLPADTSVAAAVEMCAAGILLLTIGRLRGEFSFTALPDMRRQTFLAISYLAVFGSCVGYTAYSFLLRHEPSNRVSSYAFVNPAVAVFLGVVFGGEAFTPAIALALALILSGVSLSLFGASWRRALLPNAA